MIIYYVHSLKDKSEGIDMGNLREWLNQLVIDIPNDIIKDKVKGYIENLTLYNITLEKLETTNKEIIGNKVGINLTIENAGINIKGKYIISDVKDFEAKISKLTVLFPFYLVRDKDTGLVSEVDTTGLNIDIEKSEIELELDISDFYKKAVVAILKLVLSLIKESIIQKKLVELLYFQKLFYKIY